jgi:hypothetical protein
VSNTTGFAERKNFVAGIEGSMRLKAPDGVTPVARVRRLLLLSPHHFMSGITDEK